MTGIRKLKVVCAVLISLLAVGCGTDTKTENSELENNENISSDNLESQEVNFATEIFNGDSNTFYDGYVFYNTPSGSLHMIDTNNSVDMPYCSDISCEHKASKDGMETNCISYNISSYSIDVNQDSLYFLQDDTWNVKELIKSDKTGNNQEKIAEFYNVQFVLSEIYTDQYYIFSYINSDEIIMGDDGYGNQVETIGESLNKEEIGIVMTNLETGKITTIFSDSQYENYSTQVYYYEGKIYFTQNYFDIPIDELLQVDNRDDYCHFILYSYDISTASTSVVMEDNSYAQANFAAGCFFYIDSDNVNHLIDLISAEDTTIDNAIQIAYSDKYLLYQTEGEFCLYDKDNKSVLKEVKYPESVYTVYCYYDNSVYLYMYKDDGQLEFGYLSNEDFWNGKFDNVLLWGYES